MMPTQRLDRVIKEVIAALTVYGELLSLGLLFG